MIGTVHLKVDDVIKKQIRDQLQSGCRFTVRILDTRVAGYELYLCGKGNFYISIENPQIIYKRYPIIRIHEICEDILIREGDHMVEFRISNTCRRNLLKSFL